MVPKERVQISKDQGTTFECLTSHLYWLNFELLLSIKVPDGSNLLTCLDSDLLTVDLHFPCQGTYRYLISDVRLRLDILVTAIGNNYDADIWVQVRYTERRIIMIIIVMFKREYI